MNLSLNTVKFQEWLKEELSHAEYINLHNSLGYSKKKVTLLLNDVEELSKKDIIAFCNLLGCQANTLIDEFNAGFNTLTGAETKELKEMVIIPADTGIEGDVKPHGRRKVVKNVKA